MKTPDMRPGADSAADAGLDAFFAAARSEAALSEDLAARMLRDADGIRRSRASVRIGRLAQLREMLGGWYGLGGLAAACAAGVWLGLAPPQGVPDAAALFQAQEDVTDFYLGESFAMAMAEDG
jgi:hypothetical protein